MWWKNERERNWSPNEALANVIRPNEQKSDAKMNKILHSTTDWLSAIMWLTCLMHSLVFDVFFPFLVSLSALFSFFFCCFAFAVAEILGNFAFLINFVPIFGIDKCIKSRIHFIKCGEEKGYSPLAYWYWDVLATQIYVVKS